MEGALSRIRTPGVDQSALCALDTRIIETGIVALSVASRILRSCFVHQVHRV